MHCAAHGNSSVLAGLYFENKNLGLMLILWWKRSRHWKTAAYTATATALTNQSTACFSFSTSIDKLHPTTTWRACTTKTEPKASCGGCNWAAYDSKAWSFELPSNGQIFHCPRHTHSWEVCNRRSIDQLEGCSGISTELGQVHSY